LKLQVYSACFYSDSTPAKRLVESCERFGLPLTLYGVGETFQNWYHAKVIRLREELEKSDADIVLYTDAADSWFLHADSFVEKFNRFDTRLVVSSERNCWPDGSLHSKFRPDIGSYRYPCAGQFVGYRESILVMFDAFYGWDYGHNDQAYWLKLMADRCFDAKVDSNCILFQTMDSERLDDTMQKCLGRLWNVETSTMPCLVHFNGGSKHERIAEFDRWFNG